MFTKAKTKSRNRVFCIYVFHTVIMTFHVESWNKGQNKKTLFLLLICFSKNWRVRGPPCSTPLNLWEREWWACCFFRRPVTLAKRHLHPRWTVFSTRPWQPHPPQGQPTPPVRGQTHWTWQVWSLTQFYSVDFSKSRISGKKCVFYKGTIQVCVSCWWLCPCISVVPEATHETETRVRDGDEGVAGRNRRE